MEIHIQISYTFPPSSGSFSGSTLSKSLNILPYESVRSDCEFIPSEAILSFSQLKPSSTGHRDRVKGTNCAHVCFKDWLLSILGQYPSFPHTYTCPSIGLPRTEEYRSSSLSPIYHIAIFKMERKTLDVLFYRY